MLIQSPRLPRTLCLFSSTQHPAEHSQDAALSLKLERELSTLAGCYALKVEYYRYFQETQKKDIQHLQYLYAAIRGGQISNSTVQRMDFDACHKWLLNQARQQIQTFRTLQSTLSQEEIETAIANDLKRLLSKEVPAPTETGLR